MSVMDYTFNNLTRLGDDSCDKTQRSVQNTTQANYTLSNYRSTDCSMSEPISFATSQPSVFYNGGMQSGPGGCNIDTSSDLLIGTINTHPKCRVTLLERPFKTVPFLGRGSSNPVLESHIQQGDTISNRKSLNAMSEQSYIPYKNYPLLPSIEHAMTDSTHFVEGDAYEGWVRGGMSSREYQKDLDN